MPASIVMVLDHSTSMGLGSPNLLSVAQSDASTFVTIMHIGDQLAVVGFGHGAEMDYPTSQNLITLDSVATKDAAGQAIRNIGLAGDTNMGAAVTLADTLLSGLSARRGAVLLSDGDWNFGSSPLDVCDSSIPIYTIALSTISPGGQQTLHALADKTHGKYNYVPNYRELAKIYYAIVGQANIAQVTYNESQQVAQFAFAQVPLTIAGGASSLAIALNWGDPSCQFAGGTPVGNQVNVTLQDPSGTIYSQPAETGPGFCTFNIDSPAPGAWNFGTWCAQANNFTAQAGAFERGSAIELALASVGAGAGGAVTITVTDHGEPVRGLSVRAKLVSPVSAPAPDRASKVTAHRTAPHEDPPINDHVPDVEHRQQPLATTEETDGTHIGRYAPKVTGSHTVEVTVAGLAPRTGTPFTRVGQISVHHSW